MLENFTSTIMSNYSATNCNHVFTWIINERRVFTSLCGILFSCMQINCDFLHDIKWHWWQAGRHFFMHFIDTLFKPLCALFAACAFACSYSQRTPFNYSNISIDSIEKKRIDFEYLETFMLIYTQHFCIHKVRQSLCTVAP